MNRKTVVSGIVALVMIGRCAVAETVEVDVTVKAVDAKSRAITVTYKTESGQKSIDLDVSRKAETTVNGKAGLLDSVKPGQKAKVVYEKELQVVTKIDATGEGTEPGREVYRFTLQLSEFGDGKFSIEKTSNPPPDDFEGEPFKFSRCPHTKATKGMDGMFRLVHDFSDADDLNVLSLFPPVHVTVDKEAGLLVFRTGPLQGNGEVKNGATLDYGKKFRLPLTVMLDIVEYGDCGFAVQLGDPGRKVGLLQCRIAAGFHDLTQPFEVQILWIEYDDKDKTKNKNVTELFDRKDVSLDTPFETKLRLPVPNARINETMCPRFAKMWGGKVTTVSRLEIRGRLSPMFGLGMGEKDGMVFAHNIFPKSLAERAGLQVADVILTINGKKPKTMLEAVDILSHVAVGDETIFSIQRADETKELRVVAE